MRGLESSWRLAFVPGQRWNIMEHRYHAYHAYHAYQGQLSSCTTLAFVECLPWNLPPWVDWVSPLRRW